MSRNWEQEAGWGTGLPGRTLALALVLAATGAARAQDTARAQEAGRAQESGRAQEAGRAQGAARTHFVAVRTASAPQLDGHVEEAVWAEAPVFDAFVQSFPVTGAAPSERTEVRVLYDDRNLYVAVRAYDSQPAAIARALGRRDNPPASDLVTVVVDPALTRRTGYAFTINAAGTLRDTLHFDDTQSNRDWDAVWDARAALLPDGWSAELELPLDLLRFSASSGVQLWGLHVRRELRRTTEVLDSAVMPPNANGFVSRFAALGGLKDLSPPRTLQLVPYVAGRSLLHTEPAGGMGTRALPSADLGLDLRAALSSDFNLSATFNPDFGQVEADQVQLNLGTTELFFPEKRPFFNQGLDLFAPVPTLNDGAPHRLFYSRRMGLDTPILGAAKLVGATPGGLELGVLETVVAGAARPQPPAGMLADEDTRVGFHPLRPLHLGQNRELPEQQPFTRNFLAVAVRQRVLQGSSVGASLTDSTPLSRRCTRADHPDERSWAEAGCEAAGATAAGVDFNLRSGDGEWGVRGQLSGSRRKGDVPVRTLPDGTLLRTGDMGWGLFVNGGKLGGEPFRLAASYEHSSPTLDLNAVGFNAQQNLQTVHLEAKLVRSEPWGPFRASILRLHARQSWSAEGRGYARGRNGGVMVETQLPGAAGIGGYVGFEDGQLDLRELRGLGIPYEKAPSTSWEAWFWTDESRPFSVGLSTGGYRNLPRGELKVLGGLWGNVEGTWRPLPSLQTSVAVNLNHPGMTARYLEGDAQTPLLFAALTAPQLSVTLRQQVVLSPTLTLQAYAQYFGARQDYGPYYRATYAGGPVRMTDLSPVQPEGRQDDSEFSQLNLNVVARWEYRLGSTLFAVYSRSQTGPAGAPWTHTLVPSSLRHGASSDVFMVKWTYLFDVKV